MASEKTISKHTLFTAFFTLIISVLVSSHTASQDRPNIVFITIDTLRADRLGCYGYEGRTSSNIDAVAKDGIQFTTAITPIPITGPSHASIFSGLYPRNHKVLYNGEKWDMNKKLLAEILNERGYTTAGFISVRLLRGNTSGLNRGFETYWDNFPDTVEPQRDILHGDKKFNENLHTNMRKISKKQNSTHPSVKKINSILQMLKYYKRYTKKAEMTIDASLLWIEENKNSPFFLWIHLFDPHWPYSPPHKYVKNYNEIRNWMRTVNINIKRLGPGINGTKSGFISPSDKELIHELYDGEIAYVDEQLGRLFSAMKKNNIYKDSVIIIMSDHGEMLGDKPEHYGHHHYVYNQTMEIPLIMKMPGLQSTKINELVRSIDVMPTLLSYLEIKDNEDRDGLSLLPLIKGEGSANTNQAYIETGIIQPPNETSGAGKPNAISMPSHKLGIMDKTWKYFEVDERVTSFEFLFNIKKDPGEENNLVTVYPQKVDELKDLLNVYESIPVEIDSRWRQHPAQSDDNVKSTGPEEIKREELLQDIKDLGYL